MGSVQILKQRTDEATRSFSQLADQAVRVSDEIGGGSQTAGAGSGRARGGATSAQIPGVAPLINSIDGVRLELARVTRALTTSGPAFGMSIRRGSR